MSKYYLEPKDGRKSFYRKAIVHQLGNGTEQLQSYETIVVTRRPDGSMVRHWGNWSATTGRHVAAFCGLNKKQYMALPYVPIEQ